MIPRTRGVAWVRPSLASGLPGCLQLLGHSPAPIPHGRFQRHELIWNQSYGHLRPWCMVHEGVESAEIDRDLEANLEYLWPNIKSFLACLYVYTTELLYWYPPGRNQAYWADAINGIMRFGDEEVLDWVVDGEWIKGGRTSSAQSDLHVPAKGTKSYQSS